tara:strand:+ start:876 stop:3008 length:2133 start_codon:yes stop_codon:yes gene_type:complete
MPYIGRGLTTGAQYQKLDDIAINNATTFTMSVGSANVSPDQNHLILVVNGVIQEPGTGFTVAGSTCTLASAITTSGHSGLDTIYGVIAGDAAFAAYDSIGANALGVTAGTVTASRAIVPDANKDIASFRNVTLTGELDAATLDISGNADIDGTTNLDAVDIDGAVQIDAAFTSGVDGQGYDTKFFGDTSGAYIMWDTSADDLVFVGAAGLDIAGNIDVDGTANLDVVDIDGAVQIDNTVTVGADDAGHDVIFYGNTASSNMTWDTSADDLILNDSTLYINQDDNAGSVLINSEADTAQTFYIDTPANTTGNVIIAHSCDSLTTGSMAYFHSDSDSTATRKLVNIINDNTAATGATCLSIQQDAAAHAMKITQNANDYALEIAGAGNTAYPVFEASGNALTTGSAGYFYSAADRTADFPLVEIQDDNAADGGYGLKVRVDGNGDLIRGMAQGNNTKWVVKNDGSIGIGSSTVSSPAGSLNMLRIQHATGSAGLVLCGNCDARDAWDIQANDDGNLYILRGNTTKVLIEGGDGTVQIPGSLQVTGVLTNTTRIVVQKASTSRIMGVENSHGSAPLGIDIVFGGAEPNNTTQWFVQGRDASADEFKIFSDGSYSQISDISVKENISEVDSMISKINELRVVNYNRKKDASKKNHVGIIAQELEEVFPHLISKNDDDTLMVYKIGLVMPLIKAVQELSTANDALKSRIEALENA